MHLKPIKEEADPVETNKERNKNNKPLPVAKNEDVEFNEELADENDLEAMRRAEEADCRAARNE